MDNDNYKEETPIDVVDDLMQSIGEREPHKSVFTNAASEINRLRNDKKRLIASLRTICAIVSYRYGEDENEDSDTLNAAFSVLDDDRLIGDNVPHIHNYPHKKGLYNKYTVIRNMTGMLEPACFVLTPMKDRASYIALEIYAEHTADGLLSDNVEEWLNEIPFPKS